MELDANELRELFDELKQKLVKHYVGKLDMSSAMETVLKIELYMQADFRGLWNLERKLKAKAKEAEPKAKVEDTGPSYFS